MKRSPGRKRHVTDEQVKRIREWKPLSEVARELGVSCRMAYWIRKGYHYKSPSP